jgi:hypothetical protein
MFRKMSTAKALMHLLFALSLVCCWQGIGSKSRTFTRLEEGSATIESVERTFCYSGRDN